MAWEWVAPVVTGASGAVGVVFTWLAGAQGRRHAERMVRQGREAEAHARLQEERKAAYLKGMRLYQLQMRRARYEARGETEKLHRLDERWSKADRVEMAIDVMTALRAFGSDQVIELVDRWFEVWECGDLQGEWQAANNLQALVRQELHSI